MADKITKEKIEAVVSDCQSFRELTIKLGRAPLGGNISEMKRRCIKLGIDTSHMLGKSHAKGSTSNKRRTPAEILVERDRLQGRAPIEQLRRALKESGVQYQCQVCSLKDWNGKPLTLHIDHIDGQYWNCRLTNLRYICPNCHSQTPTYCGKNVNAHVC